MYNATKLVPMCEGRFTHFSYEFRLGTVFSTTTSTLTLDHVDILVYDFFLTKTGHLRQTTIKIIKEKILDMVPNATQRRTRSMSHNHGDVGLQLDEDNAFVVSDDEDETSQSLSRSSCGSEGEGIPLDSGSSDT